MNKPQLGMIVTLVICMVIAALLPAQADLKSAPLNVNPTTGLFNIPIAAVVDPNQVVVGIHAADATQWLHIGGERKPHDSTAVLILGVARNLEIGLLGTDTDGAGVTLNGQYLLSAKGGTSVAVGLQNIDLHRGKQSFPRNDIRDLAGYVVLTQALSSGTDPVRLHVGAGTGRFDGIFGGVDFVPVRNLQLMGEWDGQETNAAARWTVYHKAHDDQAFDARLVGAYIDLKEPSFGVEFSWKQ
jgi:hypothetical protein